MSNNGNIFLVINLGCEMLYVLDQRLKAQKVEPDKGLRVLSDITGILFNPRFLDELFAAQHVGSQQNMRILLEDMASISIMRLDAFSMNKLWVLITMVFKWQISSIQPDGIHALTQRHLRGVLKLISGYPVSVKVQLAIDRFQKIMHDSSLEQTSLARNSLIFWLNDFRTKVSLLLRLGLQRNDGSFVQSSNDNDVRIFLQNVGDNIYSHPDDQPTVRDMENVNEPQSSNVDTSEVTCLVYHILGENDYKSGSINISFFHQAGITNSSSKTGTTRFSVCEFQPTSHVRDSSKSKEFFNNFGSTNLPISTLQDDLLTMLDVKSSN